jgi:hypothetical protein
VFAPKPSSKWKVLEEVHFHPLAGACMEAFLETLATYSASHLSHSRIQIRSGAVSLVDKGPERFQEKGDCSIMCDSGTKGRRVISVYGVVNSVQSRLL